MKDNDDNTRTHVALAKNTLVGHYRIVNKIGAGGMGEVYLAQDTQLDRKVALKFLPPHLCQDEDCRKRFKREAQAAAKLDHPNIISVHEVSEYQGRPYFAMAHVEGKSLKEFAVGKDLTIEQILELAIQICGGLHAAHEKGVTHRDIKPSNILIDSYGRARIVDFGLASVRDADQLTKTGSTMGTVGYMSPEQVQGKEVDHRSDLFSLGVVLYELITKQSPFKRDSEAATLKAVSDDHHEPLARFKRDIPEGMQAIIDKALEKDVTTRYQHADGLCSDLMRVKRSLESTQTFVTSAPTKKKHEALWWVAGSVVVMLAIVLWFTQRKPTEGISDKPGKIMLAVLPFENLGDPEDEYFADGITDEITSRLAGLSGLGVISRTSSIRYKNTDKSLPQIAEELGVGFILEGTIRWDKAGDTDRVRITPQLIKVSDNTHLWAESYGRDMRDIFDVQADIAAKIAAALDVTLLKPEREALEERPTDNLEAYHAFLRGYERIWRPDYTRENYDMALAALERAVELDSNFALAHAAISEAHTLMYAFGFDLTEDRLRRARAAVDRSLALQPDLADAHLALGEYYTVSAKNWEKGLQEYALAKKVRPDDYRSTFLMAIAHMRNGNYEEAIRTMEKALKLSPQDPEVTLHMGIYLTYLRDYPAAEPYFKRSISAYPDQSQTYVYWSQLYRVWKGDLGAARAVLEKAPDVTTDPILLWCWYLQEFYERDYQGALNFLTSLPADILDLNRLIRPKALMAAECYEAMGKTELARLAFDSARTLLEAKVEENSPYDDPYHSALGLAYAGLQGKDEAVREGKLATELMPLTKDAIRGTDPLEDLARIYVMVGQYEAALDQLEYLLSIPSKLSVALLRIEPYWDPLRDHPRFKALLEKYEKINGT
jgi:serine/threonine protein kinase/tetratricopeptide (TPR) repeat protein